MLVSKKFTQLIGRINLRHDSMENSYIQEFLEDNF